MFEPHPYRRMDGCRTIRLERKKGGLGLSIKGGSEHGIPIVVSSIDKGSPAGRYNVHTHYVGCFLLQHLISILEMKFFLLMV